MRRNVAVVIGLVLIAAAVFAWRSCGGEIHSKKPVAGAGPTHGGSAGHATAMRDRGPTTPASLGGRVTRASDGAGIPGAIVSIAPAELMKMFIDNDSPTILAVTDANGAWKAPRVMPGAYVVAATAKGYLPSSREKLTVGSSEQRGGVDLVLTAGGTVVSGTVTDFGGGPIADARVTANKPERASDLFGRANLVATTGADGKYELTLADGEYNLEATHDDYTSKHERVELAGKPMTVDFKLIPGAVIRGQVIARDSGKPVPGALLRAEGGSGRDGGAIADDGGNFTLKGLSSGTLEITALGRGYTSTAPTSVAVGIGEQVDGVRVLVDRGYSISGKVVRKGKQSEGLPGITLGAFSIASKTFGIALEPSAKDGSFEIVGLKPASYMLFAVGEGSVPDVGKNIEIVDKDLDGVIVELDAGVTLAGRVEPPVAAVHMSVEPAGSLGLAGMLEAAKSLLVNAETDASGAFTLKNVPRGAFALKASASDGRAGSLPIVVADNDQTGLLVRLESRASISGRVIDTSGNPVAAVNVDARRLDEDKPMFSLSGMRRDDTRTLADGTFKLVGLEAGKYRVHARVDRDEIWQSFGKKDKTPSKAEVELELAAAAAKTGITLTIEARDGVIRGVVLGPDKKPAADAWVTAHRVVEKIEGMPEGFSNRRWGGMTPVLTNGDGQFTIGKLRRGAYDLVVEGPKGTTHAEKPGVKTGESTTIQLLSLGTLSGKVTLGGALVTKYEISCDGQNDDVERQIEAKDGAYTLERLAPGPYKCNVSGDAGTAEGKIDVPSGEAKLDFALTRWASITGVVVSVLDKKPLAGIMVFAGGEYSMENVTAALTGKGPKTDANGRFVIERVAVGKGKVAVMPKEGFMPLGTRDYTAAEGQRVDLGTIEVVPPREGDAGTFGMSTKVEDGKLLVASVKDGGPAATAGVQVGDRITAINGRAVASLKLETASLLIASGNVGVGQQVQLALDRAGTAVPVTLVSVKW